MTRSERPRLRLFTSDPLAAGATVEATPDQCHYLKTVMRAQAGEAVALFNGRDGEWRASLVEKGKRHMEMAVSACLRPQSPEPDLWLLAAPIKRDCIDLVAEKASELGVSRLWPVTTKRTVMSRVNGERLLARMIEAAEQCERLSVPELAPAQSLTEALRQWPEDRILLFLDEGGAPPLAQVVDDLPRGTPLAVLTGPEGGFAPDERAWLRSLPQVRPAGLGSRILRAETAAIAALAIIGAFAE